MKKFISIFPVILMTISIGLAHATGSNNYTSQTEENHRFTLGGYCKDQGYAPTYNFKTNNYFAINIDSGSESMTVMNIDPSNNINAIIDDPGAYITPNKGCWTGNQWVGFGDIHLEGSPTLAGIAYFSVEPVSGEAKLIKRIESGQSAEYRFVSVTYDEITGKVWVLSQTDISEQTLFTAGIASYDSTTIGTINIEGNSGFADIPSITSISIGSNGMLYGTTQNSEICRIDKTNAQVIKLFDLANASTYSNTSSLFYNPVNSNMYIFNAGYLYHLNLEQQSDEEILYLGSSTFTSLFAFHYKSQVPPMDVTIKDISYNKSNNTVDFRWINPSNDFNGENLTDLGKIEIYQKTENGIDVIKVIDQPEIGEEMQESIEIEEEGILTFGIKAISKEGKSSPSFQFTDVFCYEVILPYTYGFEDNDFNIPVVFSGKWKPITDNFIDSIHSGNASYSPTEDKSTITIASIQVEKGKVYELSFWTSKQPGASVDWKAGVTGASSQTFTTSKQYWMKNVFEYVATENRNVDFYIQAVGQYGWFSGTAYIDDITILEKQGNGTPDTISLLSCKAGELGRQHAVIELTTPTLTAGGAALTQLNGVVFDIKDGNDFIPVDTLSTTETGKTILAEVSVPEPGFYTFRIRAYNDEGYCPYPVLTEETDWIGLDTIPSAPENVNFTTLPGNKMLITWDSVESIGKNGGYLDGEITSYKITQLKKENFTVLETKEFYTENPDTSIIVEEDQLYFYNYLISAVRNHSNEGEENEWYAINGVDQNQKVAMGYDRSLTQDAPFHFNASGMTSSISQSIYTAQEIGGPLYIDTLHWFARFQKDKERPVKIILTHTDKNTYSDKTDWVDPYGENSIVVFDDTLETLAAKSQNISIPIKPFFYNGTDNLAITVIKPLQDSKNDNENFYGHTFTQDRTLYMTSKSVDIDTLKTKEEIIETSQKGYSVASCYTDREVPLLVLGGVSDVAEISGSITNKVRNTPIPQANIHIKSVAGASYPIETTLLSDEEGNFSIGFLPAQEYRITISKPGFIDSSFTADILEGETYRWDISLDEGAKVDLNITVWNENGKAIPGVKATVHGPYLETEAISDENGVFSLIQLYNSTSYQISLSLDEFQTTNHLVNTGTQTKDTILVLPFIPKKVSDVHANPDENGMTISWKAPVFALDAEIQPEVGYHIYRIKDADTSKKENWILLNDSPIKGTSFEDANYTGLSPMKLLYAVEAIYSEDNRSEMSLSEIVYKDLHSNITLNFSSNGSILSDIQLKLVQQDLGGSNVYDTLVENGNHQIRLNVFKGTYALSASTRFHADVLIPTVSIGKDTSLNISFVENKENPVFLEVTSGPAAGEVHMSWTLKGIDSVEVGNETVNPTGFILFLDGMKIDSVAPECREYGFHNLFAGKYTVSIAATYASGASDTIGKEIDGVGNQQQPLAENIHIYPNPSNGTFMLQATEGAEVNIYTTEGRCIRNFIMKETEEKIHLGNTAGIYIVVVRINGQMGSIKAIVY